MTSRSAFLLTPTAVIGGWWRSRSQYEDLTAVLDSRVHRLIVGTGAQGRMRPAPGLETDLTARGTIVEILPTAVAVERVNELLRANAADWAAALHLTC